MKSAESGLPKESYPYPGLRPFAREEAELFFGRGEQIEQMLSVLEERRFLAVVGSSGCGKSSLVQAGLLPAIQNGFLTGVSPACRFVITRPGNAPFSRLAESIEAVGGGRDFNPGSASFTEATLRSGPAGLLDALSDVGLDDRFDVLILVDQFEELFRLEDLRQEDAGDGKNPSAARDEAVAFVNLLLNTVRQPRPIPVVITMRSDWIGRCDAYDGLPEAVCQSQFLTPRMNRGRLREAVEGPPRLFDATIEPELVNRVLNEIGNEHDQLPLMQHALMRTWHVASERWSRDGAKRILTREDYEKVGGFSSALSMHLEEAWKELRTPQKEHIARHLFLLMRKGGDHGALTRRMTSVKEVAEVADADVETIGQVVNLFRQDHRNFIVVSPPGAVRPDSDLDISHEALLRQWARLARWAKDEVESEDRYQQLATAADRWQDGDGGLWRPPELDLALKWCEAARPTEAWARRYGGNFNAAIKFLQASRVDREREKREKQAQANQLRRNRIFLWAVIVPLVALLLFSMVLLRSHRETMKAKNLAEARSLALMGIEAGRTTPELGILLAIEATAAAFPKAIAGADFPPGIEASLRRVTASYVRQRFDKHTRLASAKLPPRILSLDIHPTRELAVTGADSREGKARLWNYADATEWAILDHEGTSVSQLKFSPDGEKILSTTWGDAGDAYIWDVEVAQSSASKPVLKSTADARVHFTNHNDWVTSAAWHPNRALVATGARYDGTNVVKNALLLWNPQNGKIEMDLGLGGLEHEGRISSLAFSPNGKRLLSTTWERWQQNGEQKSGRLVVWDLSAAETSSNSQPIIVWQNTNAHLGNWVYMGVFSPDGNLIATGGGDGTVRVWDARSGRQLASHKHPDVVMTVAFPNDDRLLSGCNDSIVRTLDLEWIRNDAGGTQRNASPKGDASLLLHERTSFRGHQNWIRAVRSTADNRYIISTADDSSALVWKRPPGEELSVLFDPREDYSCAAMATNTNGVLLAYCGTTNGAIHVYDALSGRRVEPSGAKSFVDGHAEGYRIRSASINRDGTRLATISDDKTIVVWNLETGRTEYKTNWHEQVVYSIRFSPDDTELLTASKDGKVRLVHAKDGSPVLFGNVPWMLGPLASGGFFYDARFSRDGSRIAASASENYAIWICERASPDRPTLITGAPGNPNGHWGLVTSVAFSPDGQLLVSASQDGTCRIWDVQTRAFHSSLHPGAPVRSAEFSPDGKLLLTASSDGITRIYQFPEKVLRAELRSVEASTTANFSADGTMILTAAYAGPVNLYYTEPWNVYKLAVNRVTRRLTAEEWEQYAIKRRPSAEDIEWYRKRDMKVPGVSSGSPN
jgi:WD40 repeat protein/energy-coupling factor transporter ATP-binding protein EcfA2